MAVVGLDIHSRKPLADGASFGSVGTYERIDGIVRFAVDPAHPANQAIVDLDKGERGPDGLVHFSADFCILQPTDPAKGNGRLLYEVLNRGRKNVQRHLNRAPASGDPPVEIDPGDGFMMERGWTMAWCGWQWDVIRSDALMGLMAPQAVEGSAPISGMMSIEFQPNTPDKHKLLANRVHQPYTVADLYDPNAALSVRDWPGGERTTIARDRWRFARDEGGQPVPDSQHLWLEGGFEPGKMYEIVFRTNTCPVVGTGLLAVRDFPAFLHHGTADEGNPCADRIERAYGYGVSQSGRFLRHFLYLGLNLDEQGRQVYDGLMPQVAGARRGQFNHRFAQPSDQSQPSIGHLMPFADDPQTDPITGETGGLLDRQRALGGVPKVYVINTAAEYYRGDCSLLHTDISGEKDVEPPAEVRAYLFASSQHGPGTLPLTTVGAAEGAIGTHGFNAVDYTPLTRAALTNLDRWVSDGIEPPPNAVPRIADGTAARPSEVLPRFDAIPDITNAILSVTGPVDSGGLSASINDSGWDNNVNGGLALPVCGTVGPNCPQVNTGALSPALGPYGAGLDGLPAASTPSNSILQTLSVSISGSASGAYTLNASGIASPDFSSGVPADINLTSDTALTINVASACTPVVASRKLFYNNSGYDGATPLYSVSDDGAIDTTKVFLTAGQAASTADMANYSNYSKGINGVIYDIARTGCSPSSQQTLTGGAAAAIVSVSVGNGDSSPADSILDASSLTAGPVPTEVTIVPNGGGASIDRVYIIFPDATAPFPNNQKWHRFTLAAGGALSLAAADVSYMGWARGECNSRGTNTAGQASTSVLSQDVTSVRNALNPGPIGLPMNFRDIDKSQDILANDVTAVRNSLVADDDALKLITMP